MNSLSVTLFLNETGPFVCTDGFQNRKVLTIFIWPGLWYTQDASFWWLLDGALIGTTTSGQKGPGRNGNQSARAGYDTRSVFQIGL